MEERNSMDARAALHTASEFSATGAGDCAGLVPDPLHRLEAELAGTDGGRPDGAWLYEEAIRLLEEAWRVFTECQVMRDGLLEACQEIEGAMEGIQRRLGGRSIATDQDPQQHPANGKPAATSSSNGGSAH
jgi:hypothetical protein